jgi:1-acyl-sn-glycerol-3-phosphate acyltransferase
VPPPWLRRLLLPLLLVIQAALVIVFGVGFVLGCLAWPVTRRRRLWRVCLLALVYLLGDVLVVGACAILWLGRSLGLGRRAWVDRHRRLLGWALDLILAAARRAVGFEVVAGPPGAVDPLATPGPVIVLSRHAGPGDSFVVVHRLIKSGRVPKVVLKEALAWDPALDVLLSRLSCCFVPAGGKTDAVVQRLEALAQRLGSSDALLIFPEGGNWTPDRRRRILTRFRQRGEARRLRAAQAIPHLLPPRPTGTMACLAAAPTAGVVVVAHSGLEEIVTVPTAWRALPLRRPMTMAWWGTDRPVGPEAGEEWLLAQWEEVERWVQAHPSSEPLVW